MRGLRLGGSALLALALAGCLPGMLTTLSNQGARPVSVDMCGAKSVEIAGADREHVYLDHCWNLAPDEKQPVAITRDGKRYLYDPVPFGKILDTRFDPEEEGRPLSGFVEKKGFPVSGGKARLFLDEDGRIWIAPKGFDRTPREGDAQPEGFPLEPYEIEDIAG